MICEKCNSNRVASISGKCRDSFYCTIKNKEYDGYVLDEIGIGSDDYIEFEYCLDCGQIQGNFPLPLCKLEKDISDQVLIDFFKDYFNEGELFSDIFLQRKNNIISAAGNLDYNLHKYLRELFYCDFDDNDKVPSVDVLVCNFRQNKLI